MRTTHPKRRDPAQATPDRCYGCHRAIGVCGRAFPRQVLGASNKVHTVWLCQPCALSTQDRDQQAQEGGKNA